MNIGLIAEGKTDRIIISRILSAVLGDKFDRLISYRPSDVIDETDKFNQRVDQFSNWTLVKEACNERKLIDEFFSLEEDNLIFVIHIDTDRSEDIGYEVRKPEKRENPIYCAELRELVKSKINEWIGEHSYNICYAIAIEETEAWLLPLFENAHSHKVNDAKKRLKHVAADKKLKGRSPEDVYTLWSKEIGKKKGLDKCRSYNESLEMFVVELEAAAVRAQQPEQDEQENASTPDPA